uniref:Uncharacterized protein n=1 Tax=Oncorhynchus mykiss TaxID=8022 RepID=A0A8K9XMC5_ONCMY
VFLSLYVSLSLCFSVCFSLSVFLSLSLCFSLSVFLSLCVSLSPLVAVKFLNISLNTDVNVECKINSNTLKTGGERDKFAGRVSFKLRITSPKN